jgi:hypothetical protein
MSEQTVPRSSTQGRARATRFRVGALAVLAVAVGLVLWLVLRGSGSSPTPTLPNARAVSVQQIRSLAASVHHPVFWVGPKAGYTYELMRASDGAIYLRYLPRGVKVGTDKPYLSVATYPFPGAFQSLQGLARQKGSTPISVAHGGLAVVSSTYPESVHVAYPGVDYQVEVYDPTPGNATTIVASGALAAIGQFRPTPPSVTSKPSATTVADLKALARSLGHAVYWVGPRPSDTYEVTHTAGGQVYIRYLPPGVDVGSSRPYLTVATYPFPGALSALQALKHVVRIKLAGGGLATLDARYPNSIHLAYPGSDYQIEVYDPSAARVHQIVASGQVKPIR